MGSREGWKPQTSNPCVIVNGQITRDRRVPGCSSATLREFSFQSHFKYHSTRVQPSYINVSPSLLSREKRRNHGSRTADVETQAAISVRETPHNELSTSLMGTHMSSIMKKGVLIVLGDK